MNGARKRTLVLGAFALTLSPVAFAQVGIEHQDVACIVAGQFPVLDACFRPGPNLAKARVYFRPEGVPNWYYVDAAAAAPPKVGDSAELLCRRATLPKPKKSLIQKHVEYYVEATGKRQESIQTETYSPLVVKDAGECKKKLIAGFVPNAVVQVFPSLPAAFAAGGGLSTAAVVAVVGAGVAAGTGVAVAATNGGGDSTPAPTNPPATTPAPVPTPTPAPTTTVTTTLPAAQFNPAFKVFKSGVLEPGNSISGTEPVQLRFFMCESTGPLPLKYNVRVNGVLATAGCDSTITFTTGGFAPGFGAVVSSRGQVRTSAAAFDVVMQIQSDGPNNDPKANRALTVDVTPATAPTTTTTSTSTSTTTTIPTTSTTTSTTTTTTSTTSTTTTSTFTGCGDTVAPVGGLITPKNNETYGLPSGPAAISFTSFWTDADPNLSVEYFLVDKSSGALQSLGTSTTPSNYPFSFDVSGKQQVCFDTSVEVYGEATDLCGNVGTSNIVPLTVAASAPSTCSFSPPEVRELSRNTSPTAWTSQLEVPGGRAQVVLNGSDASFPAAGRAPLTARLRAGENRVEAQLVQAQGKPGLWRFELRPDSVVPGSIRVIAGDVALVAGDAVVFRMKGRPGERVVFVFRSSR